MNARRSAGPHTATVLRRPQLLLQHLWSMAPPRKVFALAEVAWLEREQRSDTRRRRVDIAFAKRALQLLI